MLNANIFGEAACYHTSAVQRQMGFSLFSRCLELFRQTSRVRLGGQIGQLTFGTPEEAARALALIASLEPMVIDAVRVHCCFENLFKAELVIAGFVVHEVDARNHTKRFSRLANEQKRRPIRVSEMKAAEGISARRRNDYVFHSLTPRTIGLKTMLTSMGYRRKLRIPEKLWRILEENQRRRNMVHFFLGETGPLNAAPYHYLCEVVNARVVRRYNDYVRGSRAPLLQEI